MAKVPLAENEYFSSRRRQRWIIFAVVLLLTLGIGILIGRILAPEDEAGQQATPSGPEAVTEGATRTLSGVPVGFAQSEEGAVAAATTFGRLMAGPSGSPEQYRLVMTTLAAPEWAERAQELAENALHFVEEKYGAGGSVSFSPLRYRVEEFVEEGATIQLWGVALGSGPKVQGIEESWLTATVRLIWVDGDWRVAGQSSEPGPLPELLQTQKGPNTSILNGFQEYERGPQP